MICCCMQIVPEWDGLHVMYNCFLGKMKKKKFQIVRLILLGMQYVNERT